MRADELDFLFGSHWLFLIVVLANSCRGIHSMRFITEKSNINIDKCWRQSACSQTEKIGELMYSE